MYELAETSPGPPSAVYAQGDFKVVLALHVLAVAIWLGGGVVLVALSELARSRDEPRLRALAERARRFVLLPAAIVVLGCGLGLLGIGGFSAASTWVVLALVGWAVSFAIELPLAVSDPLDEVRGDADRARLRARREALELHLARLQALVLVLVVFDMVLRP